MIKAVIIYALLMPVFMYTHTAYCDDRTGAAALKLLIKQAEKEYATDVNSHLNIRVQRESIDGKDVYYFLSGLEIFEPSGNLVFFGIRTYNQHLFHQKFPNMRAIPTEALLANFPILPELAPMVVDIIQRSGNKIVKIALTIAFRHSPLLSPATINFLSHQLHVPDAGLFSATLLALTPRIDDTRFMFSSNVDLQPVIDALHETVTRNISSSNALLIEALLSRNPYLMYFAVFDNSSPKLLETTANILSNDALEKAARQYFRNIVLRQKSLIRH